MQESGMGALLMHSPIGLSGQIRRFVEGFILGALGLGFTYWLVKFLQGRQELDTTTIGGILLLGTFGLATLIPALAMLKDFFYAFGHEISVYENGIEHRYFSKTEFWPWAELDALIYHSEIQVNEGYKFHYFDMKLRYKNKKTLRICKIYKDYQKLADLVLKTTAELLARRDFKALQAGETLSYGKVRIDKNGLIQGNKRMVWEEIEAINKNPATRSFKIIPFGETRHLFNIGSKIIFGTEKDVWNAHVLLRLIEKILGLKGIKLR